MSVTTPACNAGAELEYRMPGFSGQHLIFFLIFLAIVLIIFGPGKLPDVGSGLGKAIREFRHASTEVKDTVVNATATPVDPPASGTAPTAASEPPIASGSTKTRVGG